MAGNALVGLRSVSGGAVGVEQVGQQWADDPPEGPTGPVPVEHGDLKLVGGEGPSLSPGWVGRELDRTRPAIALPATHSSMESSGADLKKPHP